MNVSTNATKIVEPMPKQRFAARSMCCGRTRGRAASFVISVSTPSSGVIEHVHPEAGRDAREGGGYPGQRVAADALEGRGT